MTHLAYDMCIWGSALVNHAMMTAPGESALMINSDGKREVGLDEFFRTICS
jgi:hypothetical protein